MAFSDLFGSKEEIPDAGAEPLRSRRSEEAARRVTMLERELVAAEENVEQLHEQFDRGQAERARLKASGHVPGIEPDRTQLEAAQRDLDVTRAGLAQARTNLETRRAGEPDPEDLAEFARSFVEVFDEFLQLNVRWLELLGQCERRREIGLSMGLPEFEDLGLGVLDRARNRIVEFLKIPALQRVIARARVSALEGKR